MAATACLERLPRFFGFGNWADKENGVIEKANGPQVVDKFLALP
ncbi:hypothetical protein ACYZUA_24915 [Pseudomonas sp. LS2P72]